MHCHIQNGGSSPALSSSGGPQSSISFFSFTAVVQRVSRSFSSAAQQAHSAGVTTGERERRAGGSIAKVSLPQAHLAPPVAFSSFISGVFQAPLMAAALLICDCSHFQGHFLSGREERGKREGDDLSPLWLTMEASFPGLLARKQGFLPLSCALSCHALLLCVLLWVKVRRQERKNNQDTHSCYAFL